MAFRQNKGPNRSRGQVELPERLSKVGGSHLNPPRDAAKFNSPLWLICDGLKKARRRDAKTDGLTDIVFGLGETSAASGATTESG
jgi:hypothetical protein